MAVAPSAGRALSLLRGKDGSNCTDRGRIFCRRLCVCLYCIMWEYGWEEMWLMVALYPGDEKLAYGYMPVELG